MGLTVGIHAALEFHPAKRKDTPTPDAPAGHSTLLAIDGQIAQAKRVIAVLYSAAMGRIHRLRDTGFSDADPKLVLDWFDDGLTDIVDEITRRIDTISDIAHTGVTAPDAE